jgi:hypothetical protein
MPDLPKNNPNSNSGNHSACGVDNTHTTNRKEITKCSSFESD